MKIVQDYRSSVLILFSVFSLSRASYMDRWHFKNLMKGNATTSSSYPSPTSPSQQTGTSTYEVCDVSGSGSPCSTIFATPTTSACSTVLTGFFSAVTVTACDSNITFSSTTSYSMTSSPLPTAMEGCPQGGYSTYLQSMATYYVAPWQDIAANDPQDVTISSCSLGQDGSQQDCTAVHQKWMVQTSYVPTTTTSVFSMSQSFSSPVVVVFGSASSVRFPKGDVVFSTPVQVTSTATYASTTTSQFPGVVKIVTMIVSPLPLSAASEQSVTSSQGAGLLTPHAPFMQRPKDLAKATATSASPSSTAESTSKKAAPIDLHLPFFNKPKSSATAVSSTLGASASSSVTGLVESTQPASSSSTSKAVQSQFSHPIAPGPIAAGRERLKSAQGNAVTWVTAMGIEAFEEITSISSAIPTTSSTTASSTSVSSTASSSSPSSGSKSSPSSSASSEKTSTLPSATFMTSTTVVVVTLTPSTQRVRTSTLSVAPSMSSAPPNSTVTSTRYSSTKTVRISQIVPAPSSMS